MATLTVPSDAVCDNILVSNANPALALAYQDAPGRVYTRANAGKLVTHLIEDREPPFAFRDAVVGNSDVFSRKFLIAIDRVTAPLTVLDRRQFDPILALIEADVPYVALIEGNGDRWFTAPDFIQGAFDQPGNAHHADVKFVEVTKVPAMIITDDPWHP